MVNLHVVSYACLIDEETNIAEHISGQWLDVMLLLYIDNVLTLLASFFETPTPSVSPLILTSADRLPLGEVRLGKGLEQLRASVSRI